MVSADLVWRLRPPTQGGAGHVGGLGQPRGRGDSRCAAAVRVSSVRPGPMAGAGAAVGGGTSASEAVCGTARAWHFHVDDFSTVHLYTISILCSLANLLITAVQHLCDNQKILCPMISDNVFTVSYRIA